MLNGSAVHLRYEPYPLLVLRSALDPAVYFEFCQNYPDISLFDFNPKYDYKRTLSEKFAPDNYAKFIAGTEL